MSWEVGRRHLLQMAPVEADMTRWAWLAVLVAALVAGAVGYARGVTVGYEDRLDSEGGGRAGSAA